MHGSTAIAVSGPHGAASPALTVAGNHGYRRGSSHESISPFWPRPVHDDGSASTRVLVDHAQSQQAL